MPVRVLDSQGNGGATAIAEGIRWAVAHHAQIINLSLEFTAGTVKASSIPELINAIDYALGRNVLVVAASGNEGVGQLSFPAKAKGVVAVGATTPDGCLGYYSNFGPGVTLVAPGGGADADVPGDPHCHPNQTTDVDIYQETFADVDSPRYRVFGLPAGYFGTSMAAPHVSAAAALIIASGVLGPHPTVAAIIAQLTQTATSSSAPAATAIRATTAPACSTRRRPPRRSARPVPPGRAARPGRAGPTGTTGIDDGRVDLPRRYGVRMISTAQGAWWEMRLGTEPSRNRLAPVRPRLPTMMRSASRSSATSRIESAGSPRWG